MHGLTNPKLILSLQQSVRGKAAAVFNNANAIYSFTTHTAKLPSTEYDTPTTRTYYLSSMCSHAVISTVFHIQVFQTRTRQWLFLETLTFARKLVNRATARVGLPSDHVTRKIRRDVVTEVMPLSINNHIHAGLSQGQLTQRPTTSSLYCGRISNWGPLYLIGKSINVLR
jgi:hypothetical protein